MLGKLSRSHRACPVERHDINKLSEEDMERIIENA